MSKIAGEPAGAAQSLYTIGPPRLTESERLKSTPPVGKSRRAAAPAHVSSPEGRKTQVAPSVSALPKKAMAAATLGEMIVGTRVRSGGGEGCGGGGGDDGGEGGSGGGGNRGGGDGGDGGRGGAGGDGGAGGASKCTSSVGCCATVVQAAVRMPHPLPKYGTKTQP